MSEATRTVRVEEVPGELGRYRVESWSEETPNLVDVFALGCNGECDCDYFYFKCRKAYRIRRKTMGDKFRPVKYGEPGATQCRHICAANISCWWKMKTKLKKYNESE